MTYLLRISLWILGSALLMTSCQLLMHPPLVPIDIPQEKAVLLYQTPSPVGVIDETVDYAALLVANPQTGLFQLKIRLRNRSSKTTEVPYQQWQIATPEGLRSTATYTEKYPSRLAPEQTATYILDYKAIHSRKMSMMLEKPGDFKKVYKVALAPWEEVLVFSLKDSSYQAYLAQYGEDDSLAIYGPQASEQWLNDQTAYVQQVFPEKDIFVNARDSEWNVQGVIVKIMAYSLHDSLHIRYRIANQAAPSLRVMPETFALYAGGVPVITKTPVDLLIGNKTAPDKVGLAVLKSERFHANYSYPLPKPESYAEKSWELSLGVKWYEEDKPLLLAPIRLQLQP